MLGYFADEEATAAAVDPEGWLRTGDIGLVDDDGNLRITDRKKDMFIVGGFNAFPAEIEGIMLTHPSVAQVAVVGVPDERLGEIGQAFVVRRAGDEEVDEASLVAWCRDHMANYKVPAPHRLRRASSRSRRAARSSDSACARRTPSLPGRDEPSLP